MKLVLSLLFCLLGAGFCYGGCCFSRSGCCPAPSSCRSASSSCKSKVTSSVSSSSVKYCTRPARTVRTVRPPVSRTESAAPIRNELIKIHEIQMRILKSENPKEIERLNARAGEMAQRILGKYSRATMIPGLEHMGDLTKTIEYARQQRGPEDRTPPEELLRDLHREQLQSCLFCRKKN